MPKLPEVTRQDGTIYQGATFYWEVTLYEDAAHTIFTSLDGFTPVATLMTPKGVHLADFSCSYLAESGVAGVEGYKPPRIALVLPKAVTAFRNHGSKYLYNLDLVDTLGAPYRKLQGELTAERGQVTD